MNNERGSLILMLVLLALLVLVLWFGWHFVMPYTPDFLKGTPVP